MKNLLTRTLITAIFLSNPIVAFAGPYEDATYIVEQTVTKTIFLGALKAQQPLILSAIENELRKKEIKISDMKRFSDVFMKEFIDEFTVNMQQESIGFYTLNFTSEQLSDLASFYTTSTGQLLIQKTPELLLWGAKTGAIAGAAAGKNANARVAKRLRDEDISVTDDKSMMDRLLQMLK